MADNSTIILTSDDKGDQIKIDVNVLEVLLGIAAQKIDGVAAMRSNIRSGWNWVLGRTDRGKGVEIKVGKDGNIVADVYAYFDAGVNVPDVAATIQKKLSAQLTQMTDLKLTKVNVHVVGLIFPEDKVIDSSEDNVKTDENKEEEE